MADVTKKSALITSVEELASGIYSVWLKQEEVVGGAKAGQFISVYLNDKTKLLPRPISICEIDKENGLLRIVYRVAGEGTKQLADYSVGTYVDIMGPLGNGYSTEGISEAVLIGGGIGIPPMLELAKTLDCKKTIVLGYRDANLFLAKEFEKYGTVVISTEDGSVGTKGNVIDAIKAENVKGDMILSCGPTPMLKGVKAYAAENGIRAQLSLEERMACGIGACLACICKTKEKDHHTNVHNARICKDGPVFFAEDIEL